MKGQLTATGSIFEPGTSRIESPWSYPQRHNSSSILNDTTKIKTSKPYFGSQDDGGILHDVFEPEPEDYMYSFWGRQYNTTYVYIQRQFIVHYNNKWRVLSQNALSAIFDIFKVRAPSYNTNTFLMIHCSLYIKEYFWGYDQKYYKFSYYFSLYFSSLNLKYLKLTKMDITHFAIKLFKWW